VTLWTAARPTFVARLSEVRDQGGVSTAGPGLTLSAGSVVALVANFFTGMAIRRAGSKPILVAGALFYAAAWWASEPRVPAPFWWRRWSCWRRSTSSSTWP
jgi:hypothetical protein